ncbi:hypothetical protein FBR05_05405 [Deltaproteobacteria bacterium PRO3]|nr:hypothetical protein [Deltaproteobacteria bacterium PRO3]
MRARNVVIFVALWLAAFALWPAAAEAKWQTFTPPEGGFSIAMPGKPQLTQSVHKSFVGAVKESTYTIKAGGVTYSASYSELPGIAVTLGGSRTIFNKAKDGLLKEAGGSENAFNEISLGKSEGRELSFTLNGGGAGKARFFLVDKRLYVIVASGPTGAAAGIGKFLNSFKLLS